MVLKGRVAFAAKGRRQPRLKAAQPARPPATSWARRLPRLLALAYFIEREIDAGRVRDFAEAARRIGLTRARTTQVMNLMLLSPGLQEAVLDGSLAIGERALRKAVREVLWASQAL